MIAQNETGTEQAARLKSQHSSDTEPGFRGHSL
jgi:hypothetical protein